MTQTLSPRQVRRYFSKCGAREVFPISGKTGGKTDTSLTSEGSEKISRDYHTGELNPVTVCVHVAAQCPECLNLAEPKLHPLFNPSSSAPQALHPLSTFCESDDSSSPKEAAIVVDFFTASCFLLHRVFESICAGTRARRVFFRQAGHC